MIEDASSTIKSQKMTRYFSSINRELLLRFILIIRLLFNICISQKHNLFFLKKKKEEKVELYQSKYVTAFYLTVLVIKKYGRKLWVLHYSTFLSKTLFHFNSSKPKRFEIWDWPPALAQWAFELTLQSSLSFISIFIFLLFK